MAKVIGHKEPLLRLTTTECWVLALITKYVAGKEREAVAAWKQSATKARFIGKEDEAEVLEGYIDVAKEKEVACMAMLDAANELQKRLWSMKYCPKKRGGVSHV